MVETITLTSDELEKIVQDRIESALEKQGREYDKYIDGIIELAIKDYQLSHPNVTDMAVVNDPESCGSPVSFLCRFCFKGKEDNMQARRS